MSYFENGFLKSASGALVFSGGVGTAPTGLYIDIAIDVNTLASGDMLVWNSGTSSFDTLVP